MKKLSSIHIFIFCMCAFLLCILVTIAPLNRLAGTTLLASLPFSMLLTIVGTKLPTDLHLTTNAHASQINTDSIEFLAVMLCVYLFYALSVYLAQKLSTPQTFLTSTTEQTQSNTVRTIFRLIWIGAILGGVMYVLAPAMLSRDISAYAGYGRIIVVYHANPYYTLTSAFPHDAILQSNDWPNVVAAYGPVWLAICALSTLLAGNSMLHYIFLFRIFGLLVHLVNIALVTATLRKMRLTPRIIITGTLLYAWNPLVLLESCMSGHNDTAMVTCILLGILLSLRAEQANFSHIRYYLPPIIAFTCAALIKFTSVPILAFYLVLLARRVLTHTDFMQKQSWLLVLRPVAIATLVSIIVSVVLYTPLWFGHTVPEIIASLSSPPASRLAFGSLLLALQKDAAAQQLNAHLLFLSLHSTWNIINAVVVISVFILGAIWLWRIPTTRTMVQASLALLGALLIVTPWFFPWYIVWLVGLAAVCIPAQQERVSQALVWSTLVFSASAFLIYLFRGYPPIGGWSGLSSLTTIGPPLAILLFILLRRKSVAHSKQDLFKPVEEATNQLVP